MPVKNEYGAFPIESSSPVDGKKPCVPITLLPSPKAIANPNAQYTSEQTPKIKTFLPAMCAAFFIRVSPASRNANPACMNITSTAATTTQIVLAAMIRSLSGMEAPLLLRGRAGPVVHDVVDRRRPNEAVARFVAATRRIRDR